jgi:hypothetical protein
MFKRELIWNEWLIFIFIDVDVVPIKFHQFLFGEYYDHFCVFQFFSIFPVSMAFWKNQPLGLKAQLHMAYTIPILYPELSFLLRYTPQKWS